VRGGPPIPCYPLFEGWTLVMVCFGYPLFDLILFDSAFLIYTSCVMDYVDGVFVYELGMGRDQTTRIYFFRYLRAHERRERES
jgi:hypothetical protein